MSKASTTIGLISDTHGTLRQEAVAALGSCSLIVHAGDVGEQRVVTELKKIAPVIAVRGNIDRSGWSSALPLTAVGEIGPARIYVLHDLNELDLDPATAGFNLVVSGHSHKPRQTQKAGVLYVNPGSAGPRRFRLPITVARVELTELSWRVSFIDLVSGSDISVAD